MIYKKSDLREVFVIGIVLGFLLGFVLALGI